MEKSRQSQLKVIDCILTFFDFFLTLKSEKVTKLLSHITHMSNTEYIFCSKNAPTTNSLEKESMVVNKMTKGALSSLGMVFGIALKKILAWFIEVMENRKRKMYSIDNGLKVLLGGLLHLRCLHDGLDDVYKL